MKLNTMERIGLTTSEEKSFENVDRRLIMGKVEIDNFSVSMGIFGFFFTEMFIQ